MLWWDDGFGKKKKEEVNGVKDFIPEQPENEDIIVSCYRSTGAVPIPRKLSRPPARRKLSAPAPCQTPIPPPSRKLSCPTPQPSRLSAPLIEGNPTPTPRVGANPSVVVKKEVPKPIVELRLLKAQQEIIQELDEKVATDLEHVKEAFSRARSIVDTGVQYVFPKVNNVKILTGKVKTEVQKADKKMELKRGSMKEKWGLNLSYSLQENRLQIAVNKVSMFSPAAKAGICVGNVILVINDWQIEAMDKPEVALSLLLAAGFTVNLSWMTSQADVTNWTTLNNV